MLRKMQLVPSSKKSKDISLEDQFLSGRDHLDAFNNSTQ